MGISMGPILILNIMAENDSNMIDLVLTHLTHPWGPPWTLETLGDLWRPLATVPENGQNGQNDHFQACRQGSLRVTKGFQGPRGTPGMGEMSYNQIIFLHDIQIRAISPLKFP